MSVHSVQISPTHTFSKLPVPSITLIANHGVLGDAHAGATVKHLYNLKKYAKDLAKLQREDPSATLPVPKNLKQVHLIPVELLEDGGFTGMDGSRVRLGELGENITTRGVDLGALGRETRLVFVDAEGNTGMPTSSSEQSSSPEDGTKANTKSLTHPTPNNKLFVADTTDFLLLLTMVTSALFLLLRHIPHPILGLLLLFFGLFDFFRETPNPFSSPASSTNTHPPTIILTGLRNPCAKIDDFKPGLLAKSYLRDGDGKIVGARVGVMGVVEYGGEIRAGMRVLVEEPGEWVGMERI